MLSTIREKTQGWIAGIILGLIAIPFALWGINYYFEGGQPNVAEVNGVNITVDAYRQALDDQRRSLQQMLGRGIDPRLLDTPAFRERVLDSKIDEILLTADVEAQGYRVSDKELARQIRMAPQFQRDGKFDPKLYEALLRNAGMDARSFEARLRRDALLRQAESGFAQSALVTNSDVEALLRLEAQQREAAVAVLKPMRVRDKVTVSSAAVEQEYNANSERYKTPLRVRVEYIRLAAADLAREVRLTDDEIRQAMADASQGSSDKEERRASHILIKLPAGADAAVEKVAMARVQGLRAKLLAGADFATLARENSEDPGSAAQGGDLGFVGRGVLAKEFERALFAMKKSGDLSAPVRTSYGLHLIRLTGIKAGAAVPTVVRAKVEAELKAHKAEERYFELSEKFQNLIYEQPDSLKPAAEALGLKIETSSWFTRAGGAGITADAKILEAAFDPEVIEQGRNSSAIETTPNSLVALRVVAHEPSRVRPLAEVRAEIEKSLRDAALRAEVVRLAQEAIVKLNAGESLETVARQYGMDYHGARLYGRKAEGVETALVEGLFRTVHPDGGKPVHGSVSLTDGSVALFSLKRVVEPEKLADNKPEAAAMYRTIEARRGREYFDSYRAGLREQAKIKIYKDQL